ncbi:hypothetical protein DFP72DRAFT_912289 [Ephemerocybe angulata]|uniref:Uncharacterized protein n=1 Tax=Ephemerocybe angulata TaxID=980116 RepID=A0A8H6HNE0_9AGAR|nr:hypothetical protein DFP72DRAFT_912289 [Tulosesus angulatus]
MASSKTLSTTTLNLKFMQNALRSQQAEIAQLPKAAVKDDGEWEVSQAVRDAWGLKGTSASSSSRDTTDVHEQSYLPFMFQDDEDEAPKRGRRTFGKNGKEVISKPLDETEIADAAPSTEHQETDKKGRPKVHPRPVTLSGNATGGGFLRGFDQLEKAASKPKFQRTARELMFDSTAGTGSDLHASSKPKATSAPAATAKSEAPSTGFMKPAGVDEPSAAGKPKSKRKRDGAATPETARERPKKSKKLKSTT